MSTKKSLDLQRLAAADPAGAVTEEELARSREKSLAVMSTDAVQLTVGGSNEHRPVSRRRSRVVAGVAVAAAAVVAGVVVPTLLPQPAQQPIPAATQPEQAPDTSSPSNEPLPELTGRMPTFDAEIVTGGNGNKAAIAKDEPADLHMDALNVGTLGLNSGGCFAGVYPDGHSGGLIFPHGTKVTGSGVVLPDGTPISIGQQFSFGGGLSPENTDVGECSPDGSPFLVQSWVGLPSK
ncbi:hypothetical protein [Paenarthrobacter sp. JL.01a]|uniref:hypothetical protein n=1 Tax=Paenarthrobacter sp. JL.01a TaxID=2979324 RepID=UPI0021C760C9|nr:hypothetical protein [Paenarthrobacter sp. JL.01a]UXM91633.1 hypothetical protein N5P29_20425 [Paenarthrobacter sp. JL.01a]